jgi:hypothetical protein
MYLAQLKKTMDASRGAKYTRTLIGSFHSHRPFHLLSKISVLSRSLVFLLLSDFGSSSGFSLSWECAGGSGIQMTPHAAPQSSLHRIFSHTLPVILIF